MSDMETTETEAVDQNRTEAGVDPDSLGDAVVSMTEALEAKRNEGIPVDLFPPDPPEPELTAEELLDAGRIDEAREKIAARQAELDAADPNAEARREAREQREKDAATGAEFRDYQQAHDRAAAIDAEIEDLFDVDEEGDNALITYGWDDETGESVVTDVAPELITRVAAIVEGGATRDQLETIMEELGEETALGIFRGIAAFREAQAAQAEDQRVQAETLESWRPQLEAVAEFRRLAELNPQLDVARAWQAFEVMPLKDSSPEEIALRAFKQISAEDEAAELTEKKERFYIESYSKGDENHYRKQFLPTLAAKAQAGDPDSLILLREITTPVGVDLDWVDNNVDEHGRLPGESLADVVKRSPGDFMRKVTARLDAEIAREQERDADWGAKQKAAEEFNLARYGNTAGSHVDSRRRS